jgi:HEAT repeat protein
MLWWTLKQLKSFNIDKRLRAIQRLSHSTSPKGIAALVNALSDDWPHNRAAAARALGELGEPAVERTIAELQRTGYHRYPTASMAAGILGRIKDTRAVQPLIAMLGSKDHDERESAALALGEIGDLRALEPLISVVFPDSFVNVQKAVEQALASIDPNWRVSEALIATAVFAAKEDSRNAAAEMIELNAGWRSAAALKVVPRLIAALGSPSEVPARKALDRIDPTWRQSEASRAAIPRLIADLSDSHSSNRYLACVDALAELGDARAVQALIRELVNITDEPPGRTYTKWELIRPYAHAALDRIDPQWRRSEAARAAVPRLIAAVEGKDEHGIVPSGGLEHYVKARAASVLGDIGDESAVQPLINFATALAEEQRGVHKASLPRGYRHNKAIQDFLSDLCYMEEAALLSLGQIGDSRAVKPLITAVWPDYELDGIIIHWRSVRESAAAALACVLERNFEVTPTDDLLSISVGSAEVRGGSKLRALALHALARRAPAS